MLFREIVGQTQIKARLINSVRENRVSHAQLFLGMEGAGNLALAVAYAQYICCERKSEEDSCGTCSSCLKYNKLIHPDLHFVYPQIIKKDDTGSQRVSFLKLWREAFLENPYLNANQWYDFIGLENKQGIITTEDISEMMRKISLKAFESEYKCVIMWMPEKLHAAASNKMLKILEEPPQKTLFLLVAENQDLLLSTVLSRTQLIKINKVADNDMLENIMKQQHIGYQQAKNIVHLADGNYNEAIILMHPDRNVNNFAEMFIKWMRLCFKYQSNIGEIIAWTDEMIKTGREKQKSFLSYSLHIIRECMLSNFSDPDLVRLEGEELEFSKKFSAFVHEKNLEGFIREISDAYFHIERNANPKILFMDLSFKIGRLLKVKAEKVN